jgi:hypothetical protein
MLPSEEIRYIRAVCRNCRELDSGFAGQDTLAGTDEENSEMAKQHSQDVYGLDSTKTKTEIRVNHHGLLQQAPY